MKKIFILVVSTFLFSVSVYTQEVYDLSSANANNKTEKSQRKYNWGFGVSGTMRFYPLSGGATISVKTPTKIPLVFGVDLYGRTGAFYLGGIFDVWFLNVPISSRGKFYLGIGIVGGYTFTDIDYYDVGGRIPLGISFAMDKSGKYEFYIDLTPALMYRNAFLSSRERYFAWSPSIGFRFSL